jgi:integrase
LTLCDIGYLLENVASITRKPTSPFWIACYTDHAGRQRQKSTKETDRKKAVTRAQDFEEACRGRINEVQARRVLSEIYKEIHGEELRLESIRVFLKNWLARKSGETKRGTFSRYDTAVTKFIEYLGPRADRELEFIHSRDILTFRDQIAKHLSANSANTDLKILRIAFGQAWKDGLLTVNPAAQIDLLKVRSEDLVERRPFTIEELEKLLTHADEEWRGIILFGLYTGQRLGDIVRIKWDQIDLTIKEAKFTTHKTGRRVLVPLTSTLLIYLERQPKPNARETRLFPHAFNLVEKSKGDTRRLSGQFYNLMVKADLVQKRSKSNTGKGHSGRRATNPLSFHSLRHTATSWLKNAGVSEAIAMDIIGHDSSEISRNYTHIADETKRAALEKLPILK